MQGPTDRVCLFHLRCGTCRSLAEGQETTASNGQKMCPNGLHLDPSEARQEGISTKFADRRWHVAQVAYHDANHCASCLRLMAAPEAASCLPWPSD